MKKHILISATALVILLVSCQNAEQKPVAEEEVIESATKPVFFNASEYKYFSEGILNQELDNFDQNGNKVDVFQSIENTDESNIQVRRVTTIQFKEFIQDTASYFKSMYEESEKIGITRYKFLNGIKAIESTEIINIEGNQLKQKGLSFFRNNTSISYYFISNSKNFDVLFKEFEESISLPF